MIEYQNTLCINGVVEIVVRKSNLSPNVVISGFKATQPLDAHDLRTIATFLSECADEMDVPTRVVIAAGGART